MAVKSRISSRWAQAKAWASHHQEDILNTEFANFIPVELGLIPFRLTTLLIGVGASVGSDILSSWVAHLKQTTVTAIPQDDHQWLVVNAPKRPPKKLRHLKIRGIVSSVELAQQWAKQQSDRFIPRDALPWPPQIITHWSQWTLNMASKDHNIEKLSVIPQAPWEHYESPEHDIVAVRQVPIADNRLAWECRREDIPAGQTGSPPWPQLKHYPNMSHAWAVQRYDALTTEPWHIVDLTPRAMVHHWVAARELTKTDPPRWVFYQPDPPMTTWSAASDVSHALQRWSAPSAVPPDLLTDINHPAYPAIQQAWQAQHGTPTRPMTPSTPGPRGPRL